MSRKGYKLVSYQLPEELIEALKAEAEAKGTTQTALLIRALQGELGISEGTGGESILNIDERIEAAIAPLRDSILRLEQNIDQLNTQTLKPPRKAELPHKSPSENAPQSASREAMVRSDATDDKAPCPACGLKVTRREGYGKIHKTGVDAGRRKQKWRCLNPECDRFQKNFLGDWAD
jgi:hypothetical protein